jgi:transposase InsO family protein
MGISRKCVKTWIDRYRASGEAGLRDRSSRPLRTPTRTSAEVEAKVVDLRRRERRGPDWIGAELGVPARTVSRILGRHRVPRLAALDPITGAVITRIQEVMTDNAWAYKHSLRQVVAALGARQIFIRAHCPWQNGKVERLNRTLQTEWAYRQVFTSNDERAAALAPWLEYYNTQRRHSALAGHPPISRLLPT